MTNIKDRNININEMKLKMTDKVAILIDSTIDNPQDYKNDDSTFVIPVYIHFGDNIFKDGVDFTQAEFIEKTQATDTWPKTSQPSPGDFDTIYREISAKYNTILSIHLSNKLSGTFQSSIIAKGNLEDDKVETKILSIDTMNVSVGAFPVYSKAKRLLEEGKSSDEISEILNNYKNALNLYVVVKSVDFLIKGGRLKPIKGFLAKLLNKKPVIIVQDGGLIPLGSFFGFEKALEKSIQLSFESRGSDEEFGFIVGHVLMESKANELRDELQLKYPKSIGLVKEIGSALSVHTGPGAIGIVSYDL